MAKTITFPVINPVSTDCNIESCHLDDSLQMWILWDDPGEKYPHATYERNYEKPPRTDILLAYHRVRAEKKEDLLVCEDQEVSLFIIVFTLAVMRCNIMVSM